MWLHAVYSRDCLDTLRRALAEGRRSVRDVLRRLAVREVGESEWAGVAPDGRFAMNINRPEDLPLLGSRLEG